LRSKAQMHTYKGVWVAAGIWVGLLLIAVITTAIGG
jgi:hypothetical protein